ncbi:hypothetical protein [Pseudoalteromonas byunsanensis]|nr:hypothetical protein [Pseudoalteromonas byunsanensis]
MTHQSSNEPENKAYTPSKAEQVKHHRLMMWFTIIAQKLQLGQAVKVK